jgi:uncharacterized protein with ATP-grasp and redox domains
MNNVMKYLNKRVMINPVFSVSEWQLYSFSDNPEKAQKSKEAAIALNKALRKAVNKEGSTRSTVALAIRKNMLEYSNCGARDTEPWDFLLDILDDVYGP